MDYRNCYGYEVIKPTKIIKLSVKQRIKRALKNRNYKLLFVKQIEIPAISIYTQNITT